MSLCVGPRAKRGRKLLGLTATILMVGGLVLAAPAAPARADRNQCAPPGLGTASVLPEDLSENPGVGHDDHDTTDTAEPLSQVNVGALGLSTPGVLWRYFMSLLLVHMVRSPGAPEDRPTLQPHAPLPSVKLS